jgi:serine protease Do
MQLSIPGPIRLTVCFLAAAVVTCGLNSASAQQPASTTAPPGPSSFSKLVKKASPSVVNISTVKTIRRLGQTPPYAPDDALKDFFERFFGGQVPREFKEQNLGTGFIIDREGYILTNNHVVEHTDEIKVRMMDETEFIANVIGRDPLTDLALIRIVTDHALIPLPLGDSERVEVGDWVVAIGNPFGLGNTVTAGIVSAKYRQIGTGAYDKFIQTDTPINPGNSGGPLLNTIGEVIGINTAIYSQNGGNVGIGFAIPIDVAKGLLPQLKAGKVIRGWLGVVVQKVTPELKIKFNLPHVRGALVSDVTPGGPADRAGINRGDVIVSFDGKEIQESSQFPIIVAAARVGKDAAMEVIRDGQLKRFQATVGELEEGRESQEVVESKPGLGMTVDEITPELAREYSLPETSGLLLVEVEENSPAADAGFQPGDIILEIDREPVRRIDVFSEIIAQYQKGEIVLFLVNRGGSTLFLTLKV